MRSKPLNVRSEPLNVRSEPLNVRSEPLNKDFIREKKTISSQSEDIYMVTK